MSIRLLPILLVPLAASCITGRTRPREETRAPDGGAREARVVDARPDAPRPDAPGGDARLDAPRPDAPRPDVPRPDAPKLDGKKPDAPGADTIKPDSKKLDAKPDAPKLDAKKPDAPKPDSPMLDQPKTELGRCCDDNIPCTIDECRESGVCVHSILPGFCLIDGVCYADTVPNPADSCQRCVASKPIAWSSVACVRTVAGSGTPGYADGQALSAKFDTPEGIALDGQGGIYVSEWGNHRIRYIDASSPRQVTTVAGSLPPGFQDSIDPLQAKFFYPDALVFAAGSLWIADRSNARVRLFSTLAGPVSSATDGGWGYLDGPVAAAQFAWPGGLARDKGGFLYVADSTNQVVRMIANGQVTTLAGSGVKGYLDDLNAKAQFSDPEGIAVDGAGTVYVSDYSGARIRKIASGSVSTLAGNGTQPCSYKDGAATGPNVCAPAEVALDATGTKVYFADYGANALRVVENGQRVTTIAGSLGNPGLADGPATTGALLNGPTALALAPDGKIYFADTKNHLIRVYIPASP
jgi:DNA-binding beta-propeller fold protein YncE